MSEDPQPLADITLLEWAKTPAGKAAFSRWAKELIADIEAASKEYDELRKLFHQTHRK